MACGSLQAGGGQLLYVASTCTRQLLLLQAHGRLRSARARNSTAIRAEVVTPEECNEEDCAPEKEVGKVSMEWKAAEGTKVLGTYPPTSKKKWTGYVEKDTAGQTNIYAVEPTVYVSDNVISSNTAGDSSQGSEQTVLVTVGLALGLLIGAGVVLQWLSASSPSSQQQVAQPTLYTGPPLTYYIRKFSTLPSQMPAEVAPPLDVSQDSSTLQQAPAADVDVSNPAQSATGTD